MIIADKNDTKFKVMTPIRQKLISDASINAIVNGRIYPVIAPETAPTGPFIVYNRDSYSIQNTHQGIWEQRCIVFLSCVASDYDVMTNLCEMVYKSLQGFYQYRDASTGVVINSISLTDSTEDFANDLYVGTLAFEIK